MHRFLSGASGRLFPHGGVPEQQRVTAGWLAKALAEGFNILPQLFA
jgi:hypothetical protein